MRQRVLIPAFLVTFLAVTALAGCAPGQPKDLKLSGTVVAAADVNLDLEGRPSPIVVRIYQLRSAVEFNNVDFFGLYDDSAAALGADLIAFDELTLRPGQSIDYQGQFKPDAKVVGVVAAFRDINSARWRADLELPKKPGRLQVRLDKMSVSASFEK